MAKMSKPRSLPNIYLTKFHDIEVENVTKSILVCWHLSKIWVATNTLCLLHGLQNNQRYINKDSVTKFSLTLFFAVCERKYSAIVSVTIDLCQRKISRPKSNENENGPYRSFGF